MTLLQRVAEFDKTAILEFVNVYGNFVWSVARKCSSTKKEAEEYSQKIFKYIWQNATKFDFDKQTEEEFISILTMKWILQNGLNRNLAI